MRRWGSWVVILACVCLLGETPQGRRVESDSAFDAKGFQPGHDYFSPLPFENIDTITGNVYLRIPTLVLPGNAGQEVRFEWSYNSKSMQWTWGLAGIPMAVSPTQPKLRSACGPIDPGPNWYMPTLFGADGAENQTLGAEGPDPGDDLLTRNFWRYRSSTRTARLGNGLSVTYDKQSAPNSCGMRSADITRVNDPFGNELEFNYIDGMRMWQRLGDNQTREVNFFHYPDGTLHRVHHNGREWTFEYESDPVGHPRLAWIYPPEGPGWHFEYSNYDLTKVTTPNGGIVSYVFGTHSFWRDAVGSPRRLVPTKVLASRSTGGREIVGGTWTFEFNSDEDNMLTVTGPVNRIVYIAGITGSGWPVPDIRRIYDGQTLVQNEVVDWGEAVLGSRLEAEYKVPIITHRSITRGGSTYSTTYEYRGSAGVDYGSVDYGAPSKIIEDGDIDRTTDITYEHLSGPYVLRRPRVVTVAVSGQSQTFQRTYEYDDDTGFRTSATVHGVTTNFGNDGKGNVGTIDDTHADHSDTTVTYSWGVQKNVTTPKYVIARSIRERGTVEWEERDGHKTYTSFDGLNRLTSVAPPEGHSTITSYASDGTTVTVSRGQTRWTTSTLDGFGRVIRTQNSNGVKTTVSYDPAGRKKFASLPYDSSIVPGAMQNPPGATYTYDVLDRVIREDHTSGLYSTFSYPTGADVEIHEHNSGETRSTIQRWSAYGDPDDAVLVSLTDPKNELWEYEYNAIGRLTRVAQPPTRAGEPRTVRRWEYEPGTELLKKETHPEQGETSYTYVNGRLDVRTTPAGQFKHHYDGNDRVEKIQALMDDFYTLDFDYDGSDHRKLVENGSVRSTFTFTANGNIDVRTDVINGVSRTTDYDYDFWDNVSQITYPSGQKIKYTHDSQGQIATIKRVEGGADVNLATVLAYHPSGGVKELQMANGVREKVEYDPHKYVIDRIHGTGSPVDIVYGHDLVGNVTSITDNKNGTYSYPALGYDKLDRLTNVQGNFVPTQYTYDPLGNRTADGQNSYTINGSTLRLDDVSTGLSVQPPEVGQYRHDPSGNLETIGPSETVHRVRFYYTPLNMPRRVDVQGLGSTEYRYDGNNLRKLRITPTGTDIFYHGMNGAVLSEFRQDTGAGSARWVRDYVYLGSRVIASLAAQQATFAFTTSSSQVQENGGSVALTIRLTIPDNGVLAQEARVSWATQNGTAVAGSDFTAASGTEIFAAGTPSGTTRTVNVSIIDNTTFEAHETFTVVLSAPQNAQLGAAVHTVTIRDNEPDMYGSVDTPLNNAVLFANASFAVSGWAIDTRSTSGTNVATINVVLRNTTTQQDYFVGVPTFGSRPDIPPNSGFGLIVSPSLVPPPGQYSVFVIFQAASTGQWLMLNNQGAPVVTIQDPRITQVDSPAPGASIPNANPFMAGGWAIDRRATSGTGVDYVHVTANPLPSGAAIDLGLATGGGVRQDVATAYGSQNFAPSGFNVQIPAGLPPGQYRLDFRAHSTVDGSFKTTSVPVTVTVVTDPRMVLDLPVNGTTTGRPFVVGGWAVDLGAPSGTGVSTVHAWAYPAGGGSPVFLGAHYGGQRDDVAGYFGNARFTYSGFTFPSVGNLAPGGWQIVAYAWSTVTGSWAVTQSANITIPQPNLLLPIEAPTHMQTVGRPFHIAGWAADMASPNTNGVSQVHIYAYPLAGGAPFLVGVLPVGIARGDVAGGYGSQHYYSGWAMNGGGDLPPGTYSLVVYGIAPDNSVLGANYIYITVQ